MNLEDDLRAALRREPAPEGFAARVLAATAPPKRTVLPFRHSSVFTSGRALAIAAALAVAAVVPAAVYEYRRERRALEARDQLMVALSITRVQLHQAREKVRQTTRHRI
jgi:hypothetical protein